MCARYVFDHKRRNSPDPGTNCTALITLVETSPDLCSQRFITGVETVPIPPEMRTSLIAGVKTSRSTRRLTADPTAHGRSHSLSGVRNTVTAQMANVRAISPQARASITGYGKTTKAKT